MLGHCRTNGAGASITRGANTLWSELIPGEARPALRHERTRGASRSRSTATASRCGAAAREDHCAGIELVLHEGAPGEIYNVGGEDHENIEVTYRILEPTGADPA